ncbi:MAG: hypothetical protein BWY21_01031 [Parcubacteria group bacterium ADurb.Bin216]|jgi:hypothetical protein|nr:MAG: hypothetical protein BWY21_01031 [Parcubacteria group bacterium ADurb.Bin216]
MDIFYYYDPILEKSPVKYYFIKFMGSGHMLVDIGNKIVSIAEKGSISPPLAKGLSRHAVSEIMQPFRGRAIRVLCAIVGEDLILFHAFDKPACYDKNRRIDKLIEKNYGIADSRYDKYLKSFKEGKNEEFKEKFIYRKKY